ncbi:hypothetical protein EBE87_28440 [Pseudoroseomonas wenyumeiae]|uniref:DUF1918 domain-containing protein n=1 Tax=Teichococcus wenyumeiae TaxID=2478470 RepID=A0A3A9IVK0_9PROT|nr:hypothetical protein D6Z83_28405 [Pseudoroseomonas wenyumeiae]RMI13212.1 hypothetical protein EBE87_28440 [Pseudoroseomonas wenyumeiae]
MAEAKFLVGQTVTFTRGQADGNIPAGEFTILRVMPSEGGQRSYRVRGARDGQERVLPEDQLEAAGSVWSKTKR